MDAREAAKVEDLARLHKYVVDRELPLKRQLRDTHQDQLMEPLAQAIRDEGALVNELVLMARRGQGRACDPDEARELTREVMGEWGSRP